MSLRERLEGAEKALTQVPILYRGALKPFLDPLALLLRESVARIEEQEGQVEALRRLVGELGAHIEGQGNGN